MPLQYLHKSSIFVTTDFVGYHMWEDAPAEVAYLASLHRHKFHVRLEVQVRHNDRELEYHTVLKGLAQFIIELLDSWKWGWSCEDIAQRILSWVMKDYPDRDLYRVTVAEDGENGSTLEAMA